MAKNVQQNKGARVKHKCNKQRLPMCNDNSELLTSNPFFPYNLAYEQPHLNLVRGVFIIIIMFQTVNPVKIKITKTKYSNSML